jgi:hypothetical protein
MVTAFDIGVFAFFFPGAVWFGYLTGTNAKLARGLTGVDPTGRTDLIDGEPTTVTGDVSVVEPAETADRVFDDASSVGAYVWRATFPKSGKNVVDFRNRTVEQPNATFASGIESGTFTVSDGDRSASIRSGSPIPTRRRRCRT